MGGIHPGELLEFTQVNSIHHSWVNLAHSPIDELMNNLLIHVKMGEWVNGCGGLHVFFLFFFLFEDHLTTTTLCLLPLSLERERTMQALIIDQEFLT